MFSTGVFKGKAHPKMEVHLHTSYSSLVGGPSNPSSVTKSGGSLGGWRPPETGVWQTQKWCVFFFFQWTYVKDKTYITQVIYVIKSYLSVVLEFLNLYPEFLAQLMTDQKL